MANLNTAQSSIEHKLAKSVENENHFLSLMQSVVTSTNEKWDFTKAICLAKTNIDDFNNETIHKMKKLGII